MNFNFGTFSDTLIQGLRQFGLDKLEDKVALMARFADLVLRTNEELNLTRIVEPEEMALKNFLDSLSLLRLEWPVELRCLDLGTGAGFPGVPLAIAQEKWQVTLLDSLKKRLTFLEAAATELELGNVRTFHARAEDAGRDGTQREQYDLVVSRAVAALPVLLELSVPLVKVGGCFAAYKSADVDDEVASAAKAVRVLRVELEQVFPLELPYGMGRRTLLLFRKTGPTPSSYPRRAGIPAKRPLQ